MRRKTLLLLLVLSLTLAACGGQAPEQSPPGDEPAAQDVDDATRNDGPADVRVAIEGDELVLIDRQERRTLVTLDPERDGTLEHAVLRPDGRDELTVLALTHREERYELRYLVLGEDGPTDLYWFPWRLQVDDELAATRDVPPRPVWSPDGDTVAWLEWDADGTRLRTVGWIDEDRANNPSDDAVAYRLAEVPPGTQLERWERDGTQDTLVGSDGDTDWRIELEAPGRAVAMPLEGA